MYSWFWRTLPGPLLVRLLITLLLFTVLVTVLFVWIFPAVETRLPFTDVTVEPSG